MTTSREILRLPTLLLFTVLLAGWAVPKAQAADSIWIEGESPQSQAMTRHPWWYDKVKRDQLSGGDFLSNWTDKQPGEATYAFRASAGGEHAFWVRANPAATKLSYQLDGGPWQLIDMKSHQENINIADDGKIPKHSRWAGRIGAALVFSAAGQQAAAVLAAKQSYLP